MQIYYLLFSIFVWVVEGYTVPTVMRLSFGSYNRGFFCHIGGIKRPPLSRLRVKFQACLQPLSSRISRQIPPLTLVLAAALHHSVNSFPTLLILDAISNNFSWLPYLFGASQACPAAALLTVCLKCTSVKNQLSSLDPSPHSAVSTSPAHSLELRLSLI